MTMFAFGFLSGVLILWLSVIIGIQIKKHKKAKEIKTNEIDKKEK